MVPGTSVEPGKPHPGAPEKAVSLPCPTLAYGLLPQPEYCQSTIMNTGIGFLL